MANKIIQSLKSISPKMWLIMAGVLLVMVFISRAKGGSTSSIVSGGDSTGTRDAISAVADTVKNNSSQVNDAIAKQGAAFTDELNKQNETQSKIVLALQDQLVKQAESQQKSSAALQTSFQDSLQKQAEASTKLFGNLSDSFSNSLQTLKGDIGNINQQIIKQPNYSNQFAQYDQLFAGLNSSLAGLTTQLNSVITKVNQPATFNAGYGSGGGTYTSPTASGNSSNQLPAGLQPEISAPTKLGSSPNTYNSPSSSSSSSSSYNPYSMSNRTSNDIAAINAGDKAYTAALVAGKGVDAAFAARTAATQNYK